MPRFLSRQKVSVPSKVRDSCGVVFDNRNGSQDREISPNQARSSLKSQHQQNTVNPTSNTALPLLGQHSRPQQCEHAVPLYGQFQDESFQSNAEPGSVESTITDIMKPLNHRNTEPEILKSNWVWLDNDQVPNSLQAEQGYIKVSNDDALEVSSNLEEFSINTDIDDTHRSSLKTDNDENIEDNGYKYAPILNFSRSELSKAETPSTQRNFVIGCRSPSSVSSTCSSLSSIDPLNEQSMLDRMLDMSLIVESKPDEENGEAEEDGDFSFLLSSHFSRVLTERLDDLPSEKQVEKDVAAEEIAAGFRRQRLDQSSISEHTSQDDDDDLPPFTSSRYNQSFRAKSSNQCSSLNQNFRKLNLKSKRYSRHRRLNAAKYKQRMWHKKKKDNCAVCGQKGHWAQECPDAPNVHAFLRHHSLDNDTEYEMCYQERSRLDPSNYYNEEEADKLLNNTPKLFGYEDFRPGQREAIKNILQGKSTLAVLSTGAGKSFIYQAASLYMKMKYSDSIAIVISPLVSLIKDQIRCIPCELIKAVYLSGDTEKAERLNILTNIKSAHLLFLSPEMLVEITNHRHLGQRSWFIQIPAISFVCIDEVHCISSWAYNFRPTYFSLSQVLHNQYRVECMLGLTATAPQPLIKDMQDRLRMFGDVEVIRHTTIGSVNFSLSVIDCVEYKKVAALLMSIRFSDCGSVIVYCGKRREVESLHGYLSQIFKGKRYKPREMGYYHAGMSDKEREFAQQKFTCGEMKLICATVAFGMGINISHVGGVVMYGNPSNFDTLIQLVGRAGRTGVYSSVVQCHIFAYKQQEDLNDLKRHVHKTAMDFYRMRKFLANIVDGANSSQIEQNDSEPMVTICVGTNREKDEYTFDMERDNLATLLFMLSCYQSEDIKIECLLPCLDRCRMFQRRTGRNLKHYPYVDWLNKILTWPGAAKMGKKWTSFSLVELATWCGEDPSELMGTLTRMQDAKVGNASVVSFLFDTYTTPVKLTLSRPRYEALRKDPDGLTNELTQFVWRKWQMHYRSLITNTDALASLLLSCARNDCSTSEPVSSTMMIETLTCYLNGELDLSKMSNDLAKQVSISLNESARAEATVRDFIETHGTGFSAVNICKILNGIGSPRYPTTVWRTVRKFWAQERGLPFEELMSLADTVLIRTRCKV